jgi:hypothetical protein
MNSFQQNPQRYKNKGGGKRKKSQSNISNQSINSNRTIHNSENSDRTIHDSEYFDYNILDKNSFIQKYNKKIYYTLKDYKAQELIDNKRYIKLLQERKKKKLEDDIKRKLNPKSNSSTQQNTQSNANSKNNSKNNNSKKKKLKV